MPGSCSRHCPSRTIVTYLQRTIPCKQHKSKLLHCKLCVLHFRLSLTRGSEETVQISRGYGLFGLRTSFNILKERNISKTGYVSILRWNDEKASTQLCLLGRASDSHWTRPETDAVSRTLCCFWTSYSIQVQELNCSPSVMYSLQKPFGLSDTDQYVTMMTHHFQEAWSV